ncbi:porin [Ideonella sp.]|jgi:predicted porin|uniref:porin n=1 Tax=Ideonella sp. TaxID=1929293 RepID=UPI0037BE7D83
MKKFQMIAVALAAAATSGAFAQSSVNVYGRLNVSVERQKAGDVTSTNLQNNSSRIGFKGVEDLGGGLKAGFQIEHGFTPTTGAAASTFWGRQAEVNLGGSFGMVRLGTFTSEAYFATADYISMHNHDTGTSEDKLYASTWNSAKKVAYRTPTLSGFVAELAVTEGSPTTERGYDLAANYDQGPLHVGFGYNKQGDGKQFTVAGAYTMGAFTLGGYVQRDTDLSEGNVLNVTGSRTNLRLAGMYTMGATELHLNIGKAGDVGSLKDSGASQFTAGVNYNLSKRTKVYGFYTKLNANDNTPYADDFSSLAVGVRHNF